MRYRVAASLAGLALVVALIAGLAGGVRFGTTLVRALVGSAVFAGLGIAAMVVIERYLPELATPSRRGRKGTAAVEAAEEMGMEEQAPSVDIVLPEENPLADTIGADLEPADAEAAEVAEAVVEPLEPADAGGEPESLAAQTEAATETIGDDAAAEDVDALPSLEGLEVGPRESATPAPPAAESSADAHIDPSLAARGLRTWLKRDNEG